MDSTQNYVMILERSSHNLDMKKDGDAIVLEGVFAEFGVENNNQRVYEEAEYLPHLEYLNNKVAKKKLLGELDHPEKFDISLAKVSHLVEKLEYDKGKRQLRGRIRLLDTPSGRIAAGLVESGVPIGISSRAAGIVENNKKVKIKKIFTYDLVAETGFENATLERINESLGFKNSDLVAIYDMGTELPEILEGETTEPTKTTKEMSMGEFVTNEELNVYSMLVKDQFEKLETMITGMNEDKEEKFSERIVEMQKTVDKLVKHSNHVAKMTDKGIQYTEYTLEKLDRVVDFADSLAIKLDENVENFLVLEKKSNKSVKYMKYLKESLEKNIMFSEYLKECLELVADHGDHVATMTDKGIQYAEAVSEKSSDSIDESIQYTEGLAIKFDNYSKALNERLKDSQSTNEMLMEKLDKSIKYTEHVAAEVQENSEYTDFAITEALKTATPAVENQEMTMNYDSLPNQVDELIESVKKTKTNEINENLRYGFVKLLSEAKRAEFNLLDETKKQKVATALNENAQLNEEEIEKVMESVLTPAKETWIEEAPEEYKKIWESLDENSKNTLRAQSRSYKLETAYQVKNFWETRPPKLLNPTKDAALNESEATEAPKPEASPLGYTPEYVAEIENALGKLQKRK